MSIICGGLLKKKHKTNITLLYYSVYELTKHGNERGLRHSPKSSSSQATLQGHTLLELSLVSSKAWRKAISED